MNIELKMVSNKNINASDFILVFGLAETGENFNNEIILNLDYVYL